MARELEILKEEIEEQKSLQDEEAKIQEEFAELDAHITEMADELQLDELFTGRARDRRGEGHVKRVAKYVGVGALGAATTAGIGGPIAMGLYAVYRHITDQENVLKKKKEKLKKLKDAGADKETLEATAKDIEILQKRIVLTEKVAALKKKMEGQDKKTKDKIKIELIKIGKQLKALNKANISRK